MRRPESKFLPNFGDVLQSDQNVLDIDPRRRGVSGVAEINLVDGAVPRKDRPFRMLGEREDGLRALMKKFVDRGWISPSNAEWASRAFVVPKPGGEGGEKKWRLVIDYRYLNSQTKTDGHPIPVIEDMITEQAMNCLWSVFDLEDGFHQMVLREEDRHLTSFVTPWGQF